MEANKATDLIRGLGYTKPIPMFVGIDSGTVNSGLCIIMGKRTRVMNIAATPKAVTIERIRQIVTVFEAEVKKFSKGGTVPAFVVLEQPFGIKNNGKVVLELFGIFRYLCWKYRWIPVGFPQTSMKKFATGDGRADKGAMMVRAYKEFGIDNATEDAVDAFWAARVAYELYHGSTTDFRKESLGKYLEKFTF